MSVLTPIALGVLLIAVMLAVFWAWIRLDAMFSRGSKRGWDEAEAAVRAEGRELKAPKTVEEWDEHFSQSVVKKTEEIVGAIVEGRDEGLKSRRVRKLGDVSGYGLRTSVAMQREAHPEGCLVTITISGRAGSGRSSVASAIEALLHVHGIVVENTDHDGMGMIQASANLKRFGPDLTVVLRSEKVR